MIDAQLATFVVLSALLTVLPSNDTALVTRTTLLSGLGIRLALEHR